MPNWDNRYRDRLKLLIEILPVLDSEPRFATLHARFAQHAPELAAVAAELASAPGVTSTADPG